MTRVDRAISPQRALRLGTAVEIVEERPRQTPPGELPVAFDRNWSHHCPDARRTSYAYALSVTCNMRATCVSAPWSLNDRYDVKSGRVLLTGTQALVRLLLEQSARDRIAGLNTAGFVSGY